MKTGSRFSRKAANRAGRVDQRAEEQQFLGRRGADAHGQPLRRVRVPEEKWGEAVAASVVLAPGSGHDRDSMRNALRTRLAAYKIPKHIEFPAALPRTTSGKVLRRALREHMARTLTDGAPAAPSGSGR